MSENSPQGTQYPVRKPPNTFKVAARKALQELEAIGINDSSHNVQKGLYKLAKSAPEQFESRVNYILEQCKDNYRVTEYWKTCLTRWDAFDRLSFEETDMVIKMHLEQHPKAGIGTATNNLFYVIGEAHKVKYLVPDCTLEEFVLARRAYQLLDMMYVKPNSTFLVVSEGAKKNGQLLKEASLSFYMENYDAIYALRDQLRRRNVWEPEALKPYLEAGTPALLDGVL